MFVDLVSLKATAQLASRVFRRITFNGETHHVSEWARRIGIKPATLFNRFANGWSLHDALTITADTGSLRMIDPQPDAQRKLRPITFNGRTMLLTHWANELGLNVSTLRRRIETGWPLDAALTCRVNTSLYSEYLKAIRD